MAMRVLTSICHNAPTYPTVTSSQHNLAYVPKIVNSTADKLLHAGFGKKVISTESGHRLYEDPITAAQATRLDQITSSVNRFTGDLNERCRNNSEALVRKIHSQSRQCVLAVDDVWCRASGKFGKLVEQTQDLCVSRVKGGAPALVTIQHPEGGRIRTETPAPTPLLLRIQEAKPLRTGVLAVVKTMADIILPPDTPHHKMSYTFSPGFQM